MAAAAASECGGVCEVGDGDMLRAGSAELELMMRAGWDDEAEGEGEGGSELISGIALYAILQQEFVFEQRNDYRSVTVQLPFSYRSVCRAATAGSRGEWCSGTSAGTCQNAGTTH
jgi:hypothetical protein